MYDSEVEVELLVLASTPIEPDTSTTQQMLELVLLYTDGGGTRVILSFLSLILSLIESIWLTGLTASRLSIYLFLSI